MIDPTHTYPRFSYNHLGLSTQLSRFNQTSGTVVFDKAAQTAAVDVTIDMTSVDTGFPTFNEHIQGGRLPRHRPVPDRDLQVHQGACSRVTSRWPSTAT